MITAAIPKLPFIDKRKTLEFYTLSLGFNLLADHGDYFIVSRDAAELHFFAYPTLDPAKSDFMIYLRIDAGIETLHHQWTTAQPAIPRLGKLERKPWGQIEFPIIDPNGTLLTFGQGV